MFSTIGTYVGLRGGNDLPTLVRKTEPKPLRVFLQDGSNDLNNHGGNWFLANQEMLAAFEFAGYDVQHAWGDGAHDSKHGASILPDALRWLWRGYPAPVTSAGESKQPVMTGVLQPGQGWQLVGEGYAFTEAPAVNAKGEVFFADIPKNRVYRVALDGTVSVFKEESGGRQRADVRRRRAPLRLSDRHQSGSWRGRRTGANRCLPRGSSRTTSP